MKEKNILSHEMPSNQRWIRIPSSGRCEITGLSRSAFYLLIKEKHVKTASLKREGKSVGARLVWLPSLLEYIESNVDSRCSEELKTNEEGK